MKMREANACHYGNRSRSAGDGGAGDSGAAAGERGIARKLGAADAGQGVTSETEMTAVAITAKLSLNATWIVTCSFQKEWRTL